jgi:hypothetical protein
VAESEAFSIGEAAKNIVYDKKLLQGATTKVPMPQLTQMVGPIPSQQRKMLDDHYLAGWNLDSESDINALQALSGNSRLVTWKIGIYSKRLFNL